MSPTPPRRPPDPAKSEKVQRFLASMMLSLDQWREGEGYDLAALQGLSNPEAAVVLDTLLERLSGSGGDWRDVEALAALGIPPVKYRLRDLAEHPNPEVRLRAARCREEMGESGLVEAETVRMLRDPEAGIGAAWVMRDAEEHPSDTIRAALLSCALDGAKHLRVHAAALALYLAGGAPESFDWEQRPLFLQFGEDDRAVREAALQELMRRMRPT